MKRTGGASRIVRNSVGLVLPLCAFLLGSQTASQKVSLKVSSWGVLGVSGDPGPLVVAAAQAGGNPAETEDRTTSLQYSSTVPRGLKRSILVQEAGTDGAPAGCVLTLEARPSSPPREGRGAGRLTLSGMPQVLIEEIGSCATGIASGEGAVLVYRLAVEDPSRLVVGETKSLTIVFTLTDAS